MSEITVALSQEFLEAYARIPRRKQGKVMAMVTKFRATPRSPGLNYETLATPDPNLRSIRVDDDYRAIVLKPEHGNVYVLLWVDKHDDAYDWAARHRVDIHPRTGTLQILASSTEAVPAEHAEPPPDTMNAAPAETLFQARDRELLRLGVPEMMLGPVKRLTNEIELEAMAPRLPEEAFEALTFLAQGEPLNEVLETYGVPDTTAEVDRQDFAAALSRPDSQRRFRVVEEEQELERMLQAPLAHWRVFLHPSQRQLVERHWNGPMRVLGVPVPVRRLWSCTAPVGWLAACSRTWPATIRNGCWSPPLPAIWPSISSNTYASCAEMTSWRASKWSISTA